MKVVSGDFKKKSEPNTEIVAMIEGLLERAKAGEIDQIEICGLGSTSYDGFWVHADNRGWMILGQMQSLMGEANAFINGWLAEETDQ